MSEPRPVAAVLTLAASRGARAYDLGGSGGGGAYDLDGSDGGAAAVQAALEAAGMSVVAWVECAPERAETAVAGLLRQADVLVVVATESTAGRGSADPGGPRGAGAGAAASAVAGAAGVLLVDGAPAGARALPGGGWVLAVGDRLVVVVQDADLPHAVTGLGPALATLGANLVTHPGPGTHGAAPAPGASGTAPGANASLEGAVVAALSAAGRTVACAESLTAGLLAGRIASVPGASAVLRGGVVAYATDLKATLLGVPVAVLADEGAVSEACARAMASGVAARCGADHGLALTGVAGPDPQEGHPPGTVCLGLHGPTGTTATTLTLPGDRGQVRAGAVTAALEALLAELTGSAPGAQPLR